MRRYNTVCCLPGAMSLVDCEPDPVPYKNYGDYVVDDSHFVPMSEAVKRVTGGALSPDDVKVMYDFADGKDTGKKVPVDRTHSFSGDIAEMSYELRKSEASAKEQLAEAKAQFDYEQELKSINGAADTTSSNSDNA